MTLRTDSNNPTTGPAERRGPPPTAWGVVAVTVLAGTVVAFQIGKLIAALPAVSADLGIGLTLSGVLLGAFTLVSAVFGIALGPVVDRLGAVPILVVGLLVVTVGSVLGGFSASGVHLLVTTAIEGVGYVAVVVAAPTLIAHATTRADSGLALSIWGMYMPAGQATMVFVAPLLLALWTWRGIWLLNAALLLACAAAAWVVLTRAGADREPETAAGPQPGRLLRDLTTALRTPAPRLLALMFGVYVVLFSVTSFLPSVFTAQGQSATASALLTGVVILANAVGNLAAGVLLRRGAPHWGLMGGAAVVTGLAAVGIFSLGLPFGLTYAFAVVFAAAGGLLPATILAAVPVIVPNPALVPITNGMIVQAIGIGLVVGPIATGALADAAGGWHASPLMVCTASAATLLLALRIRRLTTPSIPHPGR